jgi:hypothetical protein
VLDCVLPFFATLLGVARVSGKGRYSNDHVRNVLLYRCLEGRRRCHGVATADEDDGQQAQGDVQEDAA